MSPKALFTFSERAGLLLLAQTSAVSASAIIGLLSYIAYSAVTIRRDSPRRWKVEGPAEVYFLNQLAWDLVQAIGGLINVKWAVDGSVHQGSLCSAQGAVKQASDVGVALSTLTIAIYTIKTLCFSNITNHDNDQAVKEYVGCRQGLRFSLGVVASILVAVCLLVGINIAADGSSHFYGPTGFWCWIQPHYSVQRTVADFVFMWITAAFNIVIYIILFFFLRGYIVTDGWHMSLSRNPEPFNILAPLKQAYGLLFYPLVYTAVILPVSSVRYRSFAHRHVPNGVVFFVDVIYLSNGLFNVLLFSITRPFLLPHDPPASGSITPNKFDAARPLQNEGPNERPNTDTLTVPRYDSPTNSNGPPSDSNGRTTLRWSADGVASYVNPSRDSIGV